MQNGAKSGNLSVEKEKRQPERAVSLMHFDITCFLVFGKDA